MLIWWTQKSLSDVHNIAKMKKQQVEPNADAAEVESQKQLKDFESLPTNPYPLLEVLELLQLSKYQKEKRFAIDKRQREELLRTFEKEMLKDMPYKDFRYFSSKTAEISRRQKQSERDKDRHARKMHRNELDEDWIEQERERRALQSKADRLRNDKDWRKNSVRDFDYLSSSYQLRESDSNLDQHIHEGNFTAPNSSYKHRLLREFSRDESKK